MSGDFVEGRFDFVLASVGTRFGLTELHHLAGTALRPHKDKPEKADQNDNGQNREGKCLPLRRVAKGHVDRAIVGELVDKRVGDDGGGGEVLNGNLFTVVAGNLSGAPQLTRNTSVGALDSDAVNLALFDKIHKGRILDFLARTARVELTEHEDAQNDEHDE